MNKLLILVILLIVAFGGYLVFVRNYLIVPIERSDELMVEEIYTTHVDADTGVSFAYRSEPEGYVLEDVTAEVQYSPAAVDVEKAYRLMNAEEKAELEQSEAGREGPPAISITIYRNTKNLSAAMWIDEFSVLANTHLAIGEINRDAVIAGANAVRYRTDGLYMAQNIVVAHGGYVYQFIGSYLDEASSIFGDFNDLVDSVTFEPRGGTGVPNAKIDVRTACESALAYMTFPSGMEADAFVADCIEGNRPEVIERYIADMGLDGASI